LTKGKVSKKILSDESRARFLGGRGINAKLLWDLMKRPSLDPFDPMSVLIFGTGPLTGTIAPCCGKSTVTCKGAETNLYLKSSMGGHWGAELRFAGYDHVVVQGASEKPVYLWIDDETVEIRDAKELWGKNVRDTNRFLKRELGDENIRVACIGPGGENLVRFASILCDVYHSASRGGSGAVMGSKKLKAIAVRGTGEIHVKDPEKLCQVALPIIEALAKDPAARQLYLYGTSRSMNAKNVVYSMSGRNWTVPHVEDEDAYSISGQYLVEGGYLKRRGACFGCTIGCFRYASIDSGPYAGTYTGGVQLVAFSAFGAALDTYDIEVVIKANDLCDMFGLDQASAAHAIEWAMESYARGVLTKEDTDGLDLRFGDVDIIMGLIPKIAYRKDKLGSLLADGVHRAAKKIGKDSWKWTMCNSKGLPMTRADVRVSKGYALAFAVNPRGSDHLHTETIAEWGMNPKALDLIEKLTGDKKWASPIYTEYRPEIVRWHEDVYAVTESLGLCVFTSTDSYCVNPKNMAEMFSAVTGINFTVDDIMLAGRRILTLEKCFNIREGADRRLDDLPWRMMHEPMPSGPNKGMMNSPEELEKMLDKYYALHEWEPKSSWPYEETMKMLDLQDIADELKKMGRIPNRRAMNSNAQEPATIEK
jgi:aldehyde:ferredoxin oxidoreductase